MTAPDHVQKIRKALLAGATTRQDLMEATGLGGTTLGKALASMTDRKEVLVQTRHHQDKLFSLNPNWAPHVDSDIVKLAKIKGWVRSTAAAEKLLRSKSAIEREMRRLAEAGEAIVCPVTYPDQSSELELRPAGYLPNNTNFRINYPDA